MCFDCNFLFLDLIYGSHELIILWRKMERVKRHADRCWRNMGIEGSYSSGTQAFSQPDLVGQMKKKLVSSKFFSKTYYL